MTIEVVTSCPLGSKCEEVKDGKIHRCAWFAQLAGTNPNTGAQVDERGCAMAWLPVLLVENSMQQRGTGAAIESFRDEMVAANRAGADGVQFVPLNYVVAGPDGQAMPAFARKAGS